MQIDSACIVITIWNSDLRYLEKILTCDNYTLDSRDRNTSSIAIKASLYYYYVDWRFPRVCVYIYIASNKCMYSADSSSAAVSSSQSKRLSELPLRRSIYRCDLTADSTMIATIAVKYQGDDSLQFRVDLIKNHPSSSLPPASVADMPSVFMKLQIAICKREIGFLWGSSLLMDFAPHWRPPTGRPDL